MIEVVLNTGSTIRQGAAAKGGRKLTEEYVREAAYCALNPEDRADLGCPDKVKVRTEIGEVTIFTRVDEGISRGQIFIPRGPWANLVISEKTMGTGSPCYKGMTAWVEPSQDVVLDTETLINTHYLNKH